LVLERRRQELLQSLGVLENVSVAVDDLHWGLPFPSRRSRRGAPAPPLPANLILCAAAVPKPARCSMRSAIVSPSWLRRDSIIRPVKSLQVRSPVRIRSSLSYNTPSAGRDIR